MTLEFGETMQLVNRIFVRGFVLTLILSLLMACGGKEERKAKYLEKGKTYLAEGNYDKARIEFKNVLQIDPKMADAYLYLGEINEKKRVWRKAFKNYMKASELDPERIEPRLRLATFYLVQARTLRSTEDKEGAADAMGLAREQVDEVKSRDPENLEGLTLEANLWALEGEAEKAVQQLEGVLQKDAGLQSAAMLLASLYDQEGRMNDAEAVLLQAARGSDDPLVLQQRLVQLYRKHEKNEQAEEVLRTVISANPGELAYRVSLASLLAHGGKLDEAENALREAISEDPDDAQRYLLLGEFLATKRSRQAAIDELKDAVQRKPELVDLQFGLANLYLAEGKKNEARRVLNGVIEEHGLDPAGLRARVALAQLIAAEDPESKRVGTLVEDVLKENPLDNDALLLRGRLAARTGDYAQAIGDFRTVLKDQPNSPVALRLLAAAHLGNEEPELARDTLRQGIENNPGNVELHLALAQLMVRENDFDAALEQVDAVLEIDKYNEQALKAKYGLLARKGDAAGMEEVTRLMQAAAPEKEEGYISEARLRFAQKDYDAALKILDGVLERNPESVSAIVVKIDVLAAQGKLDEAVALAGKIQQLQPDGARAYYLKGGLLQRQGDTAAALEQYEIAAQKAPESAEVLSALVNLEIGQGRADRAEQRLLATLEKMPQHRTANGLLGAVYLSKQDFAAAERAFERQLEISPETPTTYRRLAQARAAQDNLGGALAAFEQGLTVLPGNAQLMLGLAAVHERQRDYEAAISVYEKLLEQQRDNAIAINNLASLLSDHRSDTASLDKAADLAVRLEKTEQPAFLDTAGWVYYRKGDYAKAVEILKAAVERSPEVPVFQYHLGMAYLGLGDKALASEHLTKATDGEYSYYGIEEARAALKEL
jgi:tetratricopeptide (TPR) repeat protein